MRETRTFDERTKTKVTDETVKKYFLVYEGKATEQIYFKAVNAMRQQIGINPIIDLRPLVRSYSEDGWSNPKKILDRVIKNISEHQTGQTTCETMLNGIMDYLDEEKSILMDAPSAKMVWSTLKWLCEKELKKCLNDNIDNIKQDCAKICNLLAQELKIENAVSNVEEIIKFQEITYEKDFDKICLIVDRDQHSFVAHPDNDQYEYVRATCEASGFGFYLTNPCFEFWLLLHFDEVTELDKEQLLKNPKVTAKKRYAEQELHRIWHQYAKNAYDAHMLIDNIDKAIQNEKLFCEDIGLLKDVLGSNLGVLIEELRK